MSVPSRSSVESTSLLTFNFFLTFLGLVNWPWQIGFQKLGQVNWVCQIGIGKFGLANCSEDWDRMVTWLHRLYN